MRLIERDGKREAGGSYQTGGFLVIDHVVGGRMGDNHIRIKGAHHLDDAAEIFRVGENLHVVQAHAGIPAIQECGGGFRLCQPDA